MKNISPENIVLSFLTPCKEQKFIKTFKGRLFIGRLEMNRIREKTRLFYIDLVARIGATPCGGKTLRQYLHQPNTGNPWWYHPLTAKSCEHDQMFNRLLQIFTIVQILPAVGQGVIALESRSDDKITLNIIKKINHEETFFCMQAERSMLEAIGGNCDTAVGGLAKLLNKKIILKSELFSNDGNKKFVIENSGHYKEAKEIGYKTGKELLKIAGSDFKI